MAALTAVRSVPLQALLPVVLAAAQGPAAASAATVRLVQLRLERLVLKLAPPQLERRNSTLQPAQLVLGHQGSRALAQESAFGTSA